jgi:hypothetical protein
MALTREDLEQIRAEIAHAMRCQQPGLVGADYSSVAQGSGYDSLRQASHLPLGPQQSFPLRLAGDSPSQTYPEPSKGQSEDASARQCSAAGLSDIPRPFLTPFTLIAVNAAGQVMVLIDGEWTKPIMEAR